MKPVIFALALTFASTFALASAPEQSCRQSLMRYDKVPAAMFAQCEYANQFSAVAIDVATATYTKNMSQNYLSALLRIRSYDDQVCAVNLINNFDGSMTAQYLLTSCGL